jgi:hypothetical protein
MLRRLHAAFLFLFLLPITPLIAQQNLFNIPSGDITPKKKVFYQHQINLYGNMFESKGHFVYGLGGGWDAGVNLVGTGATFRPNWSLLHNDNRHAGAVYPLVLATLQKQFVLSDRIAVNIGTQAGTNLSRFVDRKTFAHFTYGLANYQVGPGRRIIAGPYVTNNAFVGSGNQAGLMLGYEWKLTDNWYLIGDWLSGQNDTGVGVIGAMFWPGKRVQFCGGVLVANPDTPKPNGFVLELNLLGWGARH